MTKVNALSAHPRMYRQVSRIFFLSISCKKWTKEHEERSPTRSPRPRARRSTAALLRSGNKGRPDRIPLPLGWCIFLPLPLGEVAECSEAGEGFASFALSVSLAADSLRPRSQL